MADGHAEVVNRHRQLQPAVGSREEWLKRHGLPPGDVEHPYKEHAGANRQHVRDMIFCFSDGLWFMMLLIFGLGGGDASGQMLRLAGVIASLAGAVCKAVSEYIKTKSQVEVYVGDLELEKEHFKYHREGEISQLRGIMQNDLGLTGRLLDEVVETIGANDDALLNVMKAFEFGHIETKYISPYRAMAVSGAMFILGGLPTWIALWFTDDSSVALVSCLVLSVVTLLGIGAALQYETRGRIMTGALSTLLAGACFSAVSYAVGHGVSAAE